MVDIVHDGAARHLAHDAREVGGGDAEFGGIEGDVVMLDEVLGQQAHEADEEFGGALAVVAGADGALLYVGEVEQEERVERALGFGAEAVGTELVVLHLVHTPSQAVEAVVGDMHHRLAPLGDGQVGRADDVAHGGHLERHALVGHQADAPIVFRAADDGHLEAWLVDVEVAALQRQRASVVEQVEPAALHERKRVGSERVLHTVGVERQFRVGLATGQLVRGDVGIVHAQNKMKEIAQSVHIAAKIRIKSEKMFVSDKFLFASDCEDKAPSPYFCSRKHL